MPETPTTTTTTTEVVTIELPTRQELREWVASHSEGAEVARCQRASLCILALYLLSKYPVIGNVVVDYDERDHPDRVGGWVELDMYPSGTGQYKPRFSHTFTDRHDLTYVLQRFDRLGYYNMPVTREQALSCFDEAGEA